MNFAEKLEAIMDYAHLTQTDLADKLGVTQAHISALISGKRQPSRKLEQKFKKTLMVYELWWETGTGKIMSEDYFEDEERKERFSKIRDAFETYYGPDILEFAEQIDEILDELSLRERARTITRIYDFLSELSIEIKNIG